MSVLERDVVLTGKDGGQSTIDFPITRLANLEDSAEVKETPAEGDFLPIVDGADGGQMKKTPLSAILGPAAAALAAAQEAQSAAGGAASTANAAAQAAQDAKTMAEGRATMEQVNAAIAAAVLDSWEGSY